MARLEILRLLDGQVGFCGVQTGDVQDAEVTPGHPVVRFVLERLDVAMLGQFFVLKVKRVFLEARGVTRANWFPFQACLLPLTCGRDHLSGRSEGAILCRLWSCFIG